jgi:hypothetical protein
MADTRAVLVYDFMPAEISFERGAAWMQTAAPAALAAAAEAAFDYSEAEGHLQFGVVRDRWDSLVLDVELSGNPMGARFGYFQGEFQLAPLYDARSHLSLSIAYELWGQSELSAGERRTAQRETEVRVREFLGLVAMQLEQAGDDAM